MAETRKEPTWEDAVAEMKRMSEDDTYDDLIASSIGKNNPLKSNGKDLAIAGIDDLGIGLGAALASGAATGAKNANDMASSRGITITFLTSSLL